MDEKLDFTKGAADIIGANTSWLFREYRSLIDQAINDPGNLDLVKLHVILGSQKKTFPQFVAEVKATMAQPRY